MTSPILAEPVVHIEDARSPNGALRLGQKPGGMSTDMTV